MVERAGADASRRLATCPRHRSGMKFTARLARADGRRYCCFPFSGLLMSGGLVLVSLPEGVSVGACASRNFPPALPSAPAGPAPRGRCCSLLAFCCSVVGWRPVSVLSSGFIWLGWPLSVLSTPTGPAPRGSCCRFPAIFFPWRCLLVLAEPEASAFPVSVFGASAFWASLSAVFTSSPCAAAPSPRIAAAASAGPKLNLIVASFRAPYPPPLRRRRGGTAH